MGLFTGALLGSLIGLFFGIRDWLLSLGRSGDFVYIGLSQVFLWAVVGASLLANVAASGSIGWRDFWITLGATAIASAGGAVVGSQVGRLKERRP